MRLCALLAFWAVLAVNGCTSEEEQDLVVASGRGQIEEVRRLIPAVGNLDYRTFNGETPLVGASSQGKTEVVRLLLAAGADPNYWDSSGSSPLFAAFWMGRAEIVKILLNAGGHLDCPTFQRTGPMTPANKYPEIADVLRAADELD